MDLSLCNLCLGRCLDTELFALAFCKVNPLVLDGIFRFRLSRLRLQSVPHYLEQLDAYSVDD